MINRREILYCGASAALTAFHKPKAASALDDIRHPGTRVALREVLECFQTMDLYSWSMGASPHRGDKDFQLHFVRRADASKPDEYCEAPTQQDMDHVAGMSKPAAAMANLVEEVRRMSK